MRKHVTALIGVLGIFIAPFAACADQARVLWWDGSPTYSGSTNAQDRQMMATYVDRFEGGNAFAVTFKHSTQPGQLAQQLASAQFDILVLDVTTKAANFTRADLDALRGHYQRGKNALMLDGTLWVRNTRSKPRTIFPGPNGAAAALLVNQMKTLKDAGGGILIGTDHREFQVGANQLLAALVPKARFTGRTNPSRDGAFLGDTLLAAAVPVKPIDILSHWEAIPSQAEVPVGQFKDFMGNAIALYPLVETSDKPGGKKKRPYISASIAPGEGRTAIDSNTAPEPEPEPEPPKNTMPTRKSKVD